MDYKVSVIIPCHNSESTLNRCIDSVVNQTLGFENIELIIYDNASDDSTKQIIKSYAEKYENIVPFFSDVNSGYPGTGRNKGIREASSEYVMFIDSDDEYDPHICEILYEAITEHEVDGAGCSWRFFQETHRKSSRDRYFEYYNNNEITYFEDTMIWDKIYKKNILQKGNILFPENEYSEDIYFNFKFFLSCGAFVYIPKYLGYIRHIQKESISRNWDIDGLHSSIITFSQIYSETKFMDYDYSKRFKGNIQFILIYIIWYNLLDDKIKCINLLKELYSFEKEISFNAHMSSKFLDIANRLVLSKRFGICFYYLKFVEKFYSNDLTKKIYNIIIS